VDPAAIPDPGNQRRDFEYHFRQRRQRTAFGAPAGQQSGRIPARHGSRRSRRAHRYAADPARNRFYILRQDKNQLQIFDASSNQMIVALRTATTPGMTISNDGNYLLVANDNSQLVSVFDLNALQAVQPIVLPGGHYGHSVASSNNAILVLANNNANNTGVIDTVNFHGHGHPAAYFGNFHQPGLRYRVLANSPNGASILVAARMAR
jgi:6-phosphogluconolactonase (cycloisomerase 2 family)